MHIHIVRRAILPVGIGPEIAAVIAAVEPDPARVAGLALADQRDIHAIRVRRGRSDSATVVVGLSRIGGHEIAVVKEGKRRPTIVGPVEGAALRQRLVDERIDRGRIGGVKADIPHLARLHVRPRPTAVEGSAQAVVGGHVDHGRVRRVDHHLVGRGAEVEEQIPGRSRIGRTVNLVVGHEIHRGRIRRRHSALGHRPHARHRQGHRTPVQAAVVRLEQAARLNARQGHIGRRRTLVKTVDVALPGHREMPLLAVVVGLERTDGLPLGIGLSLPGELAGHAASGFERRLRPFSRIPYAAIRPHAVLYVHQPMFEIPLMQGLFVGPARPPRRPLVDDRLEIIGAGVHQLGPARHVAHVLGHPFEHAPVHRLRRSLGKSRSDRHQGGQHPHKEESRARNSAHVIKVRRHLRLSSHYSSSSQVP